jgi:hypothetical protein
MSVRKDTAGQLSLEVDARALEPAGQPADRQGPGPHHPTVGAVAGGHDHSVTERAAGQDSVALALAFRAILAR